MTSSQRIIVPLHKCHQPPRWYYQLYETDKFNFLVASNAITSVPNSMKFRSVVLEFDVMGCDVITGDDVIAADHA